MATLGWKLWEKMAVCPKLNQLSSTLASIFLPSLYVFPKSELIFHRGIEMFQSLLRIFSLPDLMCLQDVFFATFQYG